MTINKKINNEWNIGLFWVESFGNTFFIQKEANVVTIVHIF